MLDPVHMAIALVAAHFVFDYPLQGDFLSKAKNKFNPVAGVPWYHAMTAHCFMHAAAVCFITGYWILGLLEFGIHFFTDYKKCQGKIGFDEDQLIHLFCKGIWVMAAVILGTFTISVKYNL